MQNTIKILLTLVSLVISCGFSSLEGAIRNNTPLIMVDFKILKTGNLKKRFGNYLILINKQTPIYLNGKLPYDTISLTTYGHKIKKDFSLIIPLYNTCNNKTDKDNFSNGEFWIVTDKNKISGQINWNIYKSIAYKKLEDSIFIWKNKGICEKC